MIKKLFLIVLIIVFGCGVYYYFTPHFVLNPSGKTPLSAVYKLPFVNKHPLTVTVKGQRGDGDLTHTFSAGYGKEFGIHGLYPEAQTEIVIDYAGKTKTYRVDIDKVYAHGEWLPPTQVVKIDTDPAQTKADNMYFISASIYGKTSAEQWVIMAFSRKGNLRYLNIDDPTRFNEMHRVVPVGEEMILVNNFGAETLLGKSVFDLRGKETEGHHDRLKIGDKFISLAFSKWGVEDRILELDGQGNILRDLSLGDLLRKVVYQKNDPAEIETLNRVAFDEKNIYVATNGKQYPVDWAHINSIVYEPTTDILYMSVRNLGVVAAKYASWELVWWMSNNKMDLLMEPPITAHNRKFLSDLPSLKPYRVKGDGLTDGPKHHHALFLLPNGVMGLFDNRGYKENESRYVEYKISGKHGAWKAKKVYQFYEPQANKNDFTGDVDVLPDGTLLLGFGPSHVIIELDKQKQKKLYQLNFALPSLMFYRVDKVPFYHTPGREYPKEDHL